VRSWRLLAVSLGVVFVAAACSATDLTVDDIRGQSFDNNGELRAWLDCDGQTISMWDATGPPSIDWNPEKVVDTAKESMGMGEQPVAADAVRAGNVWVLIDGDGRPFGGLEPGQDITWCSNG